MERFEFPGGRSAAGARVDEPADVAAAIEVLGIPHPRPVILLVGGAAGLDGPERESFRPLFEDRLAPAIQEARGVAVDGATDSGVAALIGQARWKLGDPFPLLGVTMGAVVDGAGLSGEAVALEPNHSHFLLVPGRRWGDEAVWADRACSAIRGSGPAVTVLVNGGSVAREEALVSIASGRLVLAVEGSGRAADEFAAAARGARAPALVGAVATGLVRSVEPDSLARELLKRLRPKT